MKRYLNTIESLCEESFVFGIITAAFITTAALSFVFITIATYGLTLIPVVVGWCYIIYKEANNHED